MAEFKVNVPVVSDQPTIEVTFGATSPPLKIGRHTFRLEVEDNSGNKSQPDQVVVFVADTEAPTAILTAPRQVPFGQPIPLSGERSIDAGGGNIVRWIFTLTDLQ